MVVFVLPAKDSALPPIMRRIGADAPIYPGDMPLCKSPLPPLQKGKLWIPACAGMVSGAQNFVPLRNLCELLRWKGGRVFAGAPTGEYTVRNGDAAGKVAIAANSHGISPHGIETID